MDPVDITRRFESTASNTFRLTDTPPVFVRGAGPYLFTQDDVGYLDLVGGSATSLLGHGHPAHQAAIAKALETGILHTGTRLPSPQRAHLYQMLGTVLPPHLSRIHLANSGAEAIETALKAAIHHTGRRRIIAFEGGYHGRTLGALAVTHAEGLRATFEPWSAPWVAFAPYATCPPEVAPALTVLSDMLAAGDVAALVIEAVQGVSGVRAADPGFLHGVARLAATHGTLVIADEIWTGFGRAGSWFAFDQSGLTPDLVALGKGLSASLPLSAVAGREEILAGWAPGSHTSTFQGNPLAAAAASATLQTLKTDDLIARVRDTLAPLMRSALEGVPHRVVGAQAAIDLGSQAASINVQRRALDAGLLVYGGGRQGDCVMLLPPLTIDENVLVEAITTLRELLP